MEEHMGSRPISKPNVGRMGWASWRYDIAAETCGEGMGTMPGATWGGHRHHVRSLINERLPNPGNSTFGSQTAQRLDSLLCSSGTRGVKIHPSRWSEGSSCLFVLPTDCVDSLSVARPTVSHAGSGNGLTLLTSH